jgi:hypothetical protein
LFRTDSGDSLAGQQASSLFQASAGPPGTFHPGGGWSWGGGLGGALPPPGIAKHPAGHSEVLIYLPAHLVFDLLRVADLVHASGEDCLKLVRTR